MQPTRFERAMFASLMPALALPIAAGTISHWRRPDPVGLAESPLGYYLGYQLLTTYIFVLLCSMALHAWLLLRRHENLSTKSIPKAPAFALLLLYGTLSAWLLALWFVPLSSGYYWYFVIATSAESVAVFTLITLHSQSSSPGLAAVPLTAPLRWGALGYLVLATAGLCYAITIMSTRSYIDGSGYWLPVVVALGLPLFPALVVLGWLVMIVAGSVNGGPIHIPEVAQYANALAPTVINMAIAAAVLASPSSRVIALRVLLLRGSFRAKNGKLA